MNVITEGAATAEKVIETVMRVEPTIVGMSAMFVPGAGPIVAMVQPWVLTIVPYIERALDDIAKGNNGDVFAAFVELLQHISKGSPNSPVLMAAARAEPATTATA